MFCKWKKKKNLKYPPLKSIDSIVETLFTSNIEQNVLVTKPPYFILETAPNKQERKKSVKK
jgi:hypothetical protein